MMITRGLLFCFFLSSLSQVTANSSTPAEPTPSGEYLSLHAQSPLREGRLGCSVTLTYLMPTDPVIDESVPPLYNITFTKEGSTDELATCGPEGTATPVKGDKYFAVFDKVTDHDEKAPANCVLDDCDENYHHLNVFVHYARLTIYNLDQTDAGSYSVEVSFNGVVGTASTELIVIDAHCPDNERGGSIVNFGFGDGPPNSRRPTNHTKSMVMIGPWVPPDAGFTPVSAREGEPATTDERWVVENIQIYVDKKGGSCLLPNDSAERKVCMEGLEVRVYDMDPEIDKVTGSVLSETAVATLDQRAYFIPYGATPGELNTYPIVTPFRKEPLTMKKGQYLALCTKQQRKAINVSGVITQTFETTLISEWEETKLAFGFCLDRYASDFIECNDKKYGDKREKWRNFDHEPQTWYSDAPRVSGVPDSQNEDIVEYIDYDGSGEFDAGDFEDLTKLTMKVGRPQDKNKYLQYGFKAKMVFLETWYPRPILELVVVPKRVVEDNSFLLYLFLGLLGGLLFCCCFCCVLYGRKAKHLRERRMFMSSMLGQSFNISSETGEPLPPNWYEEKSADGNIYYYNPTTQESMWDIPTFG